MLLLTTAIVLQKQNAYALTSAALQASGFSDGEQQAEQISKITVHLTRLVTRLVLIRPMANILVSLNAYRNI